MRYFLTLLCSAFLWLPGYPQEVNWDLKKDEAGIQVYTRTVKESSIKEFKAVGILPVTVHKLISILQDVEHYPEWIDDVQYSKKISIKDQKLDFYYQLHLPWPVKNRDMALTMQVIEEANNTVLQLVSNPNIEPLKSDFIRMVKVNGYWKLEPISDSSTKVTHQFLADPEGSIPAWVVNSFIVDGPYNSMVNLAKYASKD